MRKIYIRSILLFPLLTNKETGGISAAVEVDENREKGGRYSYCWPRDAVFITKAFDILKMEKATKKVSVLHFFYALRHFFFICIVFSYDFIWTNRAFA